MADFIKCIQLVNKTWETKLSKPTFKPLNPNEKHDELPVESKKNPSTILLKQCNLS